MYKERLNQYLLQSSRRLQRLPRLCELLVGTHVEVAKELTLYLTQFLQSLGVELAVLVVQVLLLVLEDLVLERLKFIKWRNACRA
jgi:hypothetical protein